VHNLHIHKFRHATFRPQIQRVCAHNNRSVPIEVLTPVNNAPWCVVRKSLLYPPIELHGHRGCAWRVIKCVPLVTDFMGRVYISYLVAVHSGLTHAFCKIGSEDRTLTNPAASHALLQVPERRRRGINYNYSTSYYIRGVFPGTPVRHHARSIKRFKAPHRL
jgi:hypothetical protein